MQNKIYFIKYINVCKILIYNVNKKIYIYIIYKLLLLLLMSLLYILFFQLKRKYIITIWNTIYIIEVPYIIISNILLLLLLLLFYLFNNNNNLLIIINK